MPELTPEQRLFAEGLLDSPEIMDRVEKASQTAQDETSGELGYISAVIMHGVFMSEDDLSMDATSVQSPKEDSGFSWL